MNGWIGEVVARLGLCKRAGMDFDTAWRDTLRACPPRGRDMGEERPTLFATSRDDVSVVEFFRAAAEDAWHGRRPALRHFDSRMIRVFEPESPGAHRHDHLRAVV